MKEKPKKSVRIWIARDKDGKLYLYSNKPFKEPQEWRSRPANGTIYLDPGLFPSVKWEDSEPTRVIVRLA